MDVQRKKSKKSKKRRRDKSRKGGDGAEESKVQDNPKDTQTQARRRGKGKKSPAPVAATSISVKAKSSDYKAAGAGKKTDVDSLRDSGILRQWSVDEKRLKAAISKNKPAFRGRGEVPEDLWLASSVQFHSALAWFIIVLDTVIRPVLGKVKASCWASVRNISQLCKVAGLATAILVAAGEWCFEDDADIHPLCVLALWLISGHTRREWGDLVTKVMIEERGGIPEDVRDALTELEDRRSALSSYVSDLEDERKRARESFRALDKQLAAAVEALRGVKTPLDKVSATLGGALSFVERQNAHISYQKKLTSLRDSKAGVPDDFPSFSVVLARLSARKTMTAANAAQGLLRGLPSTRQEEEKACQEIIEGVEESRGALQAFRRTLDNGSEVEPPDSPAPSEQEESELSDSIFD